MMNHANAWMLQSSDIGFDIGNPLTVASVAQYSSVPPALDMRFFDVRHE